MIPAQSFVLLFSNLSIDERLASHPAIKSVSKVDCARICFQRQTCSSFSYNKLTKSCIVSEQVFGKRELENKPGFQYYSTLKKNVFPSRHGERREIQKQLLNKLDKSSNAKKNTQTQKTTGSTGNNKRRKSRNNKNTKGRCPRGWTYKKTDANRCYKLVKQTKKWPDAKKSCEDEGGFLAIADSKARAELMKNYIQQLKLLSPFLKRNDDILFWLGGFYDGNVWRWVDNRTIQYEGWKEGEPTHNKDCCLRQLWIGWDDAYCTNHQYYLCQLQM